MTSKLVETFIGALVLIVAGVFLAFAYSNSGLDVSGGYDVTANFGRVDGVAPGDDVRISGIKVGSVVAQTLDPQTYRANIRMQIESKVKLPEDSSVKIATKGLLGGTYLAIDPGGSDKMIAPGGRIRYTQDAINIMGLLGRAVFGSAEEGAAKAK